MKKKLILGVAAMVCGIALAEDSYLYWQINQQGAEKPIEFAYAQVKATNTETDLVILEYAIAPDISTIMDDGLTWNRYHVFCSPVVSGLLPGELPSYENPVTTRIDSVPKGSFIAFRWRDHSPASGGNASFAYTVFRLDFVPKTGAYLYLR